MKRIICSTSNYDKDSVCQEIVDALDAGKKVYIESGAANDRILAYRENNHAARYKCEEFEFITTAAIFPGTVMLSGYDTVDCEWFKDSLFVSVS